ncbi:MAG: sensor histidine kinase [Pseudonocardiaceae bacterium]|nr:sensor histidine kinase [Pseudonocardiaceae bacterium]
MDAAPAKLTDADKQRSRWLPAILADDPDVEDGERPVRRSTRDWIVDTACFLLASGWVVFPTILIMRGEAPAGPLLVVDQIAAGLACAALWLRRRWPVGVALALLPVAVFSDLSTGAIAVSLFTVAVHRRWPVVLVVGGLHVASTVPYFLIRPSAELPYWTLMVIALSFYAALVAWGMFVRARRQLVISLRERAHRAETEVRLRDERARHLERERIAREMHDVLAHRISLLSLHAGALEFRPDAPADEIARAAGTIRDSAYQALQDLREVLGVLRGDTSGEPSGRPQPTVDDLPALLEESRQAGMHVTMRGELDEIGEVPATVGRTAYRIVQEGLTNARKHAPGREVEVSVTGAAGSGLEVAVRNALSPSGPAVPGSGSGLVGLAERVSLAGGRLEHGAASGEFRLGAWLPWPA